MCSGKTLAFQANDAGSIPAARSNDVFRHSPSNFDILDGGPPQKQLHHALFEMMLMFAELVRRIERYQIRVYLPDPHGTYA